MQLLQIPFLQRSMKISLVVQRRELDSVLSDFSKVINDIPGQKDTIAHHIDTDNSFPIH